MRVDHSRNNVIKEGPHVYYICKASPGQMIHPICLSDDNKWVLTDVTTVSCVNITHDKELGLTIGYHCINGKFYQETIEEQSIVHLDKISALHACHHRNK